MKIFTAITLVFVLLCSMSLPVFSQDNAYIQGTYKLQEWRHDLGRPALYSYSETAALGKKCHSEFIFTSNNRGSFKGSNCKSWDFQWSAKGASDHEWISGVIACEKLELKYDVGGSTEFICVDTTGVVRAGSDKFGQHHAYTKKEIR